MLLPVAPERHEAPPLRRKVFPESLQLQICGELDAQPQDSLNVVLELEQRLHAKVLINPVTPLPFLRTKAQSPPISTLGSQRHKSSHCIQRKSGMSCACWITPSQAPSSLCLNASACARPSRCFARLDQQPRPHCYGSTVLCHSSADRQEGHLGMGPCQDFHRHP